MCCTQLLAALLLLPKSDADDHTERQTERQIYGHIRLTRPHWVPLDPSMGIINKLQLCIPTLVIVIVTLIIYSIKTIEYK